MQLAAYGAQDVYLTSDPTITFWKAIYRRHTNFAMESMVQSFTGIANFGNKIQCKISRNGDLISRTYVQVTMPDLTEYGNYYMNRVGFCLLKKVELRIGGQQIDYHYNTWMHVWTELTHDVDMKELLDKLVGLKNDDGQTAFQANPGNLCIPLLFSYCRNPGLALPLIALQYHEVELWIDFETLNNCIHDFNEYEDVPNNLTLSNVNIWIDYIFLDTEERKEFAQKPHEYLIEITQSQECSISATSKSSIKLTFNHPTKFLAWVIRNPLDAMYQSFSMISGGANHVAGIKNDGSMWLWGRNHYGQLGDISDIDIYFPTKFNDDYGWLTVSSGYDNTFAIRKNYTLWATGRNNFGQLGNNTLVDLNEFTQIGIAKWSKIYSSGAHTIGIQRDGSLWSWGKNTCGQLGLGDLVDRIIPTRVGTDNDWKDIATNFDNVGNGFTFAIKNDLSLWATGYNIEGQLGIGNNINQNTLQNVPGDWSFISCGDFHTLAINNNNELYSWGKNNSGQLGLGDNIDRDTPTKVNNDTNWIIVHGGFEFSAATNTDGTLYTWGNNDYGQLANGDNTGIDINIPTEIVLESKCINIEASMYSLYITEVTLELYVAGYNYYGQLGLGFASQVNVPNQFNPSSTDFTTMVSNKYYDNGLGLNQQYTMALKPNGTLWGWGNNDYFQLGLGPLANNEYILPQQIGTNIWVDISSGSGHTVGIRNDGTLWGVGYNQQGQLGQGNTVNQNDWVQIGTQNNWRKVSCGVINTAVINYNGELWICGYNFDGQCAQNTGFGGANILNLVQEHTLSTDWEDVVCGGYHMIGTKTNNKIYGWGWNNNGQAGVGDYINKDTPTLIGTSTWTNIQAGERHTIGLDTNNSIWSWGYNFDGQLGINNNIDVNVPTLISNDNWIKISSTNNTSFAIKNDGSLWGWGLNDNGQVGLGNTDTCNFPCQIGNYTIWTNIFAGALYSYGKTTDGLTSIWAWGKYTYVGFYTANIYSLIELPYEFNDYFTSFSSYNYKTSSLESAKLLFNGQERFQERNSVYFNYIQPYQHFEIKPDIGINVYSFAVKPAEHQPSGTCNFSRIDNINLEIKPTVNPEISNLNTSELLQLSIYAFSYNVLRIASGMGGLAFSN